MPRKQVVAAQPDLALLAGRHLLARVGIDDPHLDALERPAATAELVRRQVLVQPVAAVGTERLGHAEEVGPGTGRRTPLGRKHGGQAPVAQGGQVGLGEARLRGQPSRLVRPATEQRRSLALEELERRRRFGLGFGQQGGAGDQRGQEALAEPARPEEGHRDVQALARTDAAGLESRCHRTQRGTMGVDHALGRAPGSRGEEDDHVVGRPHPLLRARAPGWPALRPPGRPSVVQTRRNDGAAGWRAPARTAAAEPGSRLLELVEVAAAPELGRRDEVRHRRRGELRQQLRRSQQGAQGHQHRPDPHDGEPDDRPFDAVRGQQADPVALDHTVGHEPGRHDGAHCRRARRRSPPRPA